MSKDLAAARSLLDRVTREDTDSAIALLTAAIQEDPRDPAARVLLSRGYLLRAHSLGQGREWLDAALREAEHALAIDPQNAMALAALSTVYSHRGWLRRDIELQRRMLGSRPDDPGLLRALGWLQWFSGDASAAVRSLRRSIELAPAEVWPHFYLGNSYLSLERDEEALAAYGEAARLDPTLSSPRIGECWSHIALERDGVAGEALQRLVAMPPDEDRVHVKIADVALYLGDLELARSHAELAVAQAPESRYRPRGVCATTILARLVKGEDPKRAAQLLASSERLDQQRITEGDEGYEPRYDLAAVAMTRGDASERDRWLAEARAVGWRFERIARRDPLLSGG